MPDSPANTITLYCTLIPKDAVASGPAGGSGKPELTKVSFSAFLSLAANSNASQPVSTFPLLNNWPNITGLPFKGNKDGPDGDEPLNDLLTLEVSWEADGQPPHCIDAATAFSLDLSWWR